MSVTRRPTHQGARQRRPQDPIQELTQMYPLSNQAPVTLGPLPMSHGGRHVVWPACDPSDAANHQQYCWRAGTHTHLHQQPSNSTYSTSKSGSSSDSDFSSSSSAMGTLQAAGVHGLECGGSSDLPSAEVVWHFFEPGEKCEKNLPYAHHADELEAPGTGRSCKPPRGTGMSAFCSVVHAVELRPWEKP